MIQSAIGLTALAIIAVGLCYFTLAMGAGVLELRRRERTTGIPAHSYGGETGGSGDGGDRAGYTVFYLLPCLNEEAVIGESVHLLLRDPGAVVVVIDDASADRTAQLAVRAGGDRALVVRRYLPDARKGKGAALNAGFEELKAQVRERGLDPARVIVCVMDADGRLSNGALDHVLPLFDNPKVGGAQVAVRIRNRETNLLTRIQDFEFWGLSAVSQFGRSRFGTVSLGGNGQFTRLSALLELDADPWTDSLTEDLDLALTLLIAGWQLTTTVQASVDQQGLEALRPLLRQRTRWFQGHMTCGRRIPEIWRSRKMANSAVLEVILYLLVPWVMVLPWSLLFHVGAYHTVTYLGGPEARSIFSSSLVAKVAIMVAWYVLSFLPSIVAGYLYYRQDRSLGRARSIFLGHMLVVTNYLAYVACWRGFFRMQRGETGWQKTSRVRESASPERVPDPVPVDGHAVGVDLITAGVSSFRSGDVAEARRLLSVLKPYQVPAIMLEDARAAARVFDALDGVDPTTGGEQIDGRSPPEGQRRAFAPVPSMVVTGRLVNGIDRAVLDDSLPGR